MIASKFLSVATANPGSGYATFPDKPCHSVNVLNATGQSLTFQHVNDADNGTFVLPDGLAWSFRGLNNANQLRVKRTDSSNTPVTVNSIEIEL